jgi:type I site-specific restriction endonuclease
LYLADRNILVDQPKDGLFAAFGDARYKIESGEVVQSREMYFAIYQALAEDERREGRRTHLQERRAGPRRRLDDRVQADHRARHTGAR